MPDSDRHPHVLSPAYTQSTMSPHRGTELAGFGGGHAGDVEIDVGDEAPKATLFDDEYEDETNLSHPDDTPMNHRDSPLHHPGAEFADIKPTSALCKILLVEHAFGGGPFCPIFVNFAWGFPFARTYDQLKLAMRTTTKFQHLSWDAIRGQNMRL